MRWVADHRLEESDRVVRHDVIGQGSLEIGRVPVSAPFRGDDSEPRTEVRHLRTPGLVRRDTSMEQHKWLARTLLVVPSLQLTDLDIATHHSSARRS